MKNQKVIKADILKRLEKTKGIISSAIKPCNITRRTFYNWLDNDPEFKEAVDEIVEAQIDWVESKFLDKIEKLDTTAITFYLKMKGKDRGYVERIETKDVTNEYKSMSADQRKEEFKKAEELFKKIKLKKVS